MFFAAVISYLIAFVCAETSRKEKVGYTLKTDD